MKVQRHTCYALIAVMLIVLASSLLGFGVEFARGLEPREPTMAEGLYIVNLGEAMSRKYNFTFWPPSGIPEDYNLTGVVLLDMDPNAPDSVKKAFIPERVLFLYSTHPLNLSMTLSEFNRKYSVVIIGEVYGTGGNSTSATYLWGYPASIKPGYVQILKFDEHTAYSVSSGTLSQEQLLTIAKSLITRPYQIRIVTSTLTSITTTTVSTILTSTTTAISTETVADPSTYAWAVSATIAVIVLAVVLVLQRRRK